MRYMIIALSFASVLSLLPPAYAADMPAPAAYTKAPGFAAPYNWSGYYIGATAGVGWSAANVDLDPVNGFAPNYRPQDLSPVAALGSQKINGSNAIFGGKLGYNYQFNTWVVGIEADLSSFHFNTSLTTAGNPFPGFAGGSATFNTNVSSDWLVTLRPRIGYSIDRVFLYGTGGLALAKVSFSNTEREFSANGFGFGNEASAASQTKLGWDLGAGVDYALTHNWILSAEYLHVDLGSIHASGLVTSGNPATATLNFSTRLRSDIIRAGIAYKF